MAYTTFQPKDYFNTKLYTGDGNATNAITGVGFQPDWVWIKNRGTTARHVLFDAVRGSQKALFSHLTDAEQSTNQYGTLNSFDSDGFTVADGSSSGERTNNSSENYVSWNWKANGAGSANTDGTINTTSTSVNTTAGISICTWTGTGSAGTIGHGLGVKPSLVLAKKTGASQNWYVYHSSLGATKYLHLNTYTSEGTASSVWNNTEPTTSVISLGTDTTQSSTYVAYCFAEKKGFSKFGSYTGNGNANGAFIYTGFKPGFILTKLSSTGSEDWKLHDIKRPGFNLTNYFLQTSNNGAELDTSNQMDILSNGFKWRSANTATNSSGNTIVYMAFAAEPLVSSNNIPATAR